MVLTGLYLVIRGKNRVRKEPVRIISIDKVLSLISIDKPFSVIERMNSAIIYIQINHAEICCAKKKFLENLLKRDNAIFTETKQERAIS
jgi:hypothetical protein